ncbi:hypothetical protein POTOM_015415 [Populus tomentosa]|uniref:Uncharacterized protein n=1 Tax=Populus tomentosa TaxID=118781 RepID=A0A8X7ZXM9_POPTO|nr:hypothetical protein POTOM_015415 [Populus tomentosa]
MVVLVADTNMLGESVFLAETFFGDWWVIGREREVVAVGLGELRKCVDKRVEDLYLVEVAERMSLFGIGVCDPEKVSRLSMESKNSAENFGLPTDFSVTMALR